MRPLLALTTVALLAAPAAAHGESLPMRLPVGAGASARAATAQPASWVLGVRGAHGRAIARRAGAEDVVPGAVKVPRARAAALAAQLRRAGALAWAQGDVHLRRQSAYDQRLDLWARGAVVPPTLAAPAPGPAIGIVDDRVDPATPDVGPIVRALNAGPVAAEHGTEVASVAAGLYQGAGVTGIYPGAPLLSYATDLSCTDIAMGIEAEREAGARVINLSLGSPGECLPITIAVQRAFAAGSVIVAASGNEFGNGNPVIYPAASPHVISVAAVDEAGKATAFSTANAAVDVAAPGVAVPVALPLDFDTEDGTRDGVTLASGTSFSAPIVSGVAAWLQAARPGLDAGQYGDLVRAGALDLGKPGYDADTGYGRVFLPNSLQAPTPRPDAREPNDGITFVDGTILGKKAPPVWSGGAPASFVATADLVEDPADVYPVRLKAGEAVAARVRQLAGDANVGVFPPNAKTINGSALAVSRHKGARTDTVRVRNNSSATRTYYVAVVPNADARALNCTYQLTVQRSALRR